MTLSEFHPRPRAVDWRVLAAERVAPLLAEEADRWARFLDWDCSAEWTAIERARQTGIAPGIAILDENGAVAGWSHYQTRHHVLQISAFSARNETIAQLMLDQILSVPALAVVHSVSFFAFADTPGLASALRQHGLSVERYFYMARDLTRNEVRELIRLGLEHTRGNYKMLVTSFNMPPEDYKKFLNFLRKYQCHVPFQRFRMVPATLLSRPKFSASA